MAQVPYPISIDEELIPIIAGLAQAENRNKSNMTETLIREALQGRTDQPRADAEPARKTQEEPAA